MQRSLHGHIHCHIHHPSRPRHHQRKRRLTAWPLLAALCWVNAPTLAAEPTQSAAHKAPHKVPHNTTSNDTQAITHLMKATWDKPDAPLTVRPVVLRGAHAVAGWTQGERGGRALLARNSNSQQWQLVLCAGDGLKAAKTLKDAGLPAQDAEALSQALAKAESQLPAAERAKFSTFDGMVRMDAHGNHPPGHEPAKAATPGAHQHH